MEFTLTGLELPVRIRFERPISDDELLRLSGVNEGLQLELEPDGELTVMSPGGAEAGDIDAEINFQLRAWPRRATRV